MLDINKIYDMENEIKGNSIVLKNLSQEKTVVVIVDMVNGFVYEGQLSSPRITTIIDKINEINKSLVEVKKIYFIDQHEEDSSEFNTYVKHCIRGTSESQLIPELILDNNSIKITKNSTNGFHAPEFIAWLQQNEAEIENYIVVGCEVDICVTHFATTLKTYFNEKNLNKRIIVPIDAVETFDYETHNGDLMKILSLWEMKSNGIEIVDKVN